MLFYRVQFDLLFSTSHSVTFPIVLYVFVDDEWFLFADHFLCTDLLRAIWSNHNLTPIQEWIYARILAVLEWANGNKRRDIDWRTVDECKPYSIAVALPSVGGDVLEELKSTRRHRLHPAENIRVAEMERSTLEHYNTVHDSHIQWKLCTYLNSVKRIGCAFDCCCCWLPISRRTVPAVGVRFDLGRTGGGGGGKERGTITSLVSSPNFNAC